MPMGRWPPRPLAALAPDLWSGERRPALRSVAPMPAALASGRGGGRRSVAQGPLPARAGSRACHWHARFTAPNHGRRRCLRPPHAGPRGTGAPVHGPGSNPPGPPLQRGRPGSPPRGLPPASSLLHYTPLVLLAGRGGRACSACAGRYRSGLNGRFPPSAATTGGPKDARPGRFRARPSPAAPGRPPCARTPALHNAPPACVARKPSLSAALAPGPRAGSPALRTRSGLRSPCPFGAMAPSVTRRGVSP